MLGSEGWEGDRGLDSRTPSTDTITTEEEPDDSGDSFGGWPDPSDADGVCGVEIGAGFAGEGFAQ